MHGLTKDSSTEFKNGYLDGLMASVPDSRIAFVLKEYIRGYIAGRKERDESPIILPEWMTPEQYKSILKLYIRDNNGVLTVVDFLKKVENYGDYCGLPWAGMFIGIEKDGYAHS